MKRFIVIILSLPLSFLSMAQQIQRPAQDEVESRKIAFLATAISLTPAEATRFWPVYNEWSKKLEDNLKARHDAFREIRQLGRDKKTDEKAYAKLSQILINGAAQEARIISEAHQAYVSILGEIRTAQLYLAEEQFRGMLIRELRQQQATSANRDEK